MKQVITPPQHTPEWISAVEKSYRNCSGKNMDEETGKKSFFFPFIYLKSKLFGDKLISQPFIDFGGPLGEITKEGFQKNVCALKETYGQKVKYIEIRMNANQEHYPLVENILLQEGFKKEKIRHQFIIDLTTENEESLWKKPKREVRKAIRKAEKSNLILKDIDNEDELEAFYNLYLNNMKYFGTPQHSYRYFLNMMNALGKNFKGVNCYKENVLAASLICFCSEKYLYAAFNPSNPSYRIYNPNEKIYWEMLKWALREKITYFDFGQCEINAPEKSHAEGIYRFKEKWKGTPYERAFFRYSSKKKGDELNEKEKYGRLSKLWRYLPKFLIRILGPRLTAQLGI